MMGSRPKGNNCRSPSTSQTLGALEHKKQQQQQQQPRHLNTTSNYTMSYYLALIGTTDNPIYEAEFGTYRQGGDGTPKFSPEMKELSPFVVHAALDVVEDLQWKTNTLYLKAVDDFYGYTISAFVTPGNVKFLLLHETKNEEGIRQFFNDVNDLYVKTLLNPFYNVNDPIMSPVFDLKVKGLAKKYL